MREGGWIAGNTHKKEHGDEDETARKKATRREDTSVPLKPVEPAGVERWLGRSNNLLCNMNDLDVCASF